MPRGKAAQPTEPTSVPLPPVTDLDRAIARAIEYSGHTRMTCGDVTVQFNLLGTLDNIQAQIAALETAGWRPCLAPDAEARERKDTNRDTIEQEEQGNTPPMDFSKLPRRNGQRDYQPKGERRMMPFGKYKGTALSVVEARDPDYVDWLAENANFADVKKAARKLIATRDTEELPF